MWNDGLSAAPGTGDIAEELLKAAREADQPLTVANIVKRATTTRKVKPAEATKILDRFVATGALKQFPPKSAKGKPLYWGHDPRVIARAAYLGEVERAAEPISTSDVNKRRKFPFKFTLPEVASILQELAQAGRIHEIPAKTAKSGPRYWNSDAIEFARREILSLLETKGAQTESVINRSVKWLDADSFQRLIQELTRAKSIYLHPSAGKAKKAIYGARPPSPEPYLTKIETQLRSVVELLKSADVPIVDMRRALVQMIESVGVPIGFQGAGGSSGVSQPKQGYDFIATMKRIEPAAERGALVTARDLRRATGLAKAEFDALALELAQHGKLVLHEHDFPSSLTPEERQELITDGRGTYYIGLALRPGQGTA